MNLNITIKFTASLLKIQIRTKKNFHVYLLKLKYISDLYIKKNLSIYLLRKSMNLFINKIILILLIIID